MQVRFSTPAVSGVGAAAATPARASVAGSSRSSNAGSTPFHADRRAAQVVLRERASAARLQFSDAAAAHGFAGSPGEGFGGSAAPVECATAPQLRFSDAAAAQGYAGSHDMGCDGELRASAHAAKGSADMAAGRGCAEGGSGQVPAGGPQSSELAEATEDGAMQLCAPSSAVMSPGELSRALLPPALLGSVQRARVQPLGRTPGPRSGNSVIPASCCICQRLLLYCTEAHLLLWRAPTVCVHMRLDVPDVGQQRAFKGMITCCASKTGLG